MRCGQKVISCSSIITMLAKRIVVSMFLSYWVINPCFEWLGSWFYLYNLLSMFIRKFVIAMHTTKIIIQISGGIVLVSSLRYFSSS